MQTAERLASFGWQGLRARFLGYTGRVHYTAFCFTQLSTIGKYYQ